MIFGIWNDYIAVLYDAAILSFQSLGGTGLSSAGVL